MYNFDDLKKVISISDTKVECPVNGCNSVVEKQKKSFKREEKFYCKDHKIYISPSTFEYEDYKDNLLWRDKEDLALLEAIFKTKRESRMSRERSEDALTWNVFRYLDKKRELVEVFSDIIKKRLKYANIIYWSYSQGHKSTFPLLEEARKEFGESTNRGSEPDLIIDTDKALFFIEAKFCASNNTYPNDINSTKKYLTGGNEWFKDVFCSNYTDIINDQKYELLRFLLLGSWMAKQTGKDFYLINVVPLFWEENIEANFGKHIFQNDIRRFKRLTWENFFTYIDLKYRTVDEKLLSDYLKTKTMGYSNGNLTKLLFNTSLREKKVGEKLNSTRLKYILEIKQLTKELFKKQ